MSRAPDVLVVTVNYKSAALTLRAVESLREERARNPTLGLQVVVVENASGDEQALRVLEGPAFRDWVTLIISPVNGGFGAGNNMAMRWAKEHQRWPRYFHFLNPDTVVRPGGVAELVRFLDAHPAAGMAGSCLENEDGSDWSTAFRFPTILSEVEEGLTIGPVTRLLAKHTVARAMGSAPEQADWLSGASFAVRADMVTAIGGFDEGFFLYFEEVDWALRARRAGFETWYVPASRVMHVAGQSTGVTTRTGAPKALPPYWFQSRRRFFSKNHGVAYAAAADLAFLTAHAVGTVKRTLKRQVFRPRLLRGFLDEAIRFHLSGAGIKPEEAPLREPVAPAATSTATTARTR